MTDVQQEVVAARRRILVPVRRLSLLTADNIFLILRCIYSWSMVASPTENGGMPYREETIPVDYM